MTGVQTCALPILTLEISAQNDALAADAGNQPTTRTQQVTSTVSGRLGEWLVLGDTSQQNTENSSTISTRNLSNTQEQRNVLLKVEEVN